MDSKPKTLAKKTAIYVDIDDDLTTVVGKIRSSSADVIALVPPKRIGVLQSAVNLKLLSRTATSSKKKLIIITSDNSLAVLAAGAKIPTADSLTSEPKMAEIPKLDSKDQIIEGEVSTPRIIKNDSDSKDDKEISAAVKALADDDNMKTDSDKSNDKKKIKIPNFNKFRKWIIVGAVALGALIVTIVALTLSSNATITITAKTTDEKIDQAITIAKDNGATNASDFKIKAVALDPVKSTTEIEFQATGKKEIGEKAKGAISIKKTATGSQTLLAGTMVFIGNYRYSIDSDITVSGSTVDNNNNVIPGEAKTVNVTAQDIGSEYNVASGTVTIGVDGLTASVSSAITGGSRETVTIVQQSDIDTITNKIKSDTENNNMKADLEKRFDASTRAITDSFEISFGTVSSSPGVGEAADRAKVSIEITYSMFGIKNDDINSLLMEAAKNKVNKNSGLGVFDNGYSTVNVSSFQLTSTGGTARLVTTAKLGPEIDDEKLMTEAAGKKKNEIKEMVEKISGVEEVEVSLFPFWISKAPEGKIIINKNGF